MTDIRAARLTPCDQHDTESFSLAGTESLDDCFRAVAAGTDVNLIVDPSDPTSLVFGDVRITGHAFSGGLGAPTCSITLAETRTDPLIDR